MTDRLAIFFLMTLVSISASHCHTPAPPAQLHWLPAAALPADSNGKAHAGLAGAVSGMVGKSYIIAGGANFPEAMPWEGGKKQYHADIHVFGQQADGKLQYVGIQGSLPIPLAYPAIAQGNDEILVAGGETINGFSNECYKILYGPGTSLLLKQMLPPLPVATAYASSYLFENVWMVAGGETKEGTTDKVWKLDLHHPEEGWQAAPSLPQALAFATMAALTHPKGKTEWRIAGGRCRVPGSISMIYNDVYVLAHGSDAWQKADTLPYAMSAMSSTVLPDGTWVIFSGDRGQTFSKVERMILDIDMATDDTAKQQLIDAKAALQSAHPGFSTDVWSWRRTSANWIPLNSIPLPPPVTTHAVYSNGNIYIGSGE
ncbi:MAG TPA: hypothetical protein VK907_05645, partial [Phnomibacter sp.]|nr:hypothetical protein [Phnomibacter sp.]